MAGNNTKIGTLPDKIKLLMCNAAQSKLTKYLATLHIKPMLRYLLAFRAMVAALLEQIDWSYLYQKTLRIKEGFV